jgi:hypothetical protein
MVTIELMVDQIIEELDAKKKLTSSRKWADEAQNIAMKASKGMREPMTDNLEYFMQGRD